MKTIERVVSALAFDSNSKSKSSYRVVGSTDINGNGTIHDIVDVDPFVLLDETNMSGDESWPFPKHPHMGLVAMTYMLNGEVRPWDNFAGFADFTNIAGGVYYINSGDGILHEEEPVIAGGPLRWLQCWMLPDVHDAPLPKASTQLARASDIPEYVDDHVAVRVLVGNAYDLTSPIQPHWPIQYLDVTVKPNQTVTLAVSDRSWHGFAYVLKGSGKFGANKAAGNVRDCLVMADDNEIHLRVVNDDNLEPLHFVLVTGKPHNKPFYKILGGGGALITGSEAKARSGMEKFQSEGDDFGK